MREDNRVALRQNGFVVYLSSTPERLLSRTRYDKNRPLLQTEDPLSTLRNLYNIRHPIYQSVAHAQIMTGSGQVTHVAMAVINEVIQYIAQQQGLTDQPEDLS